MFILQLNPMHERIEVTVPVAVASTQEQLQTFLDSERASEPYSDGRWRKSFKQGGPLEWFNPPPLFAGQSAFVDIGTREQWVEQGGVNFDNLCSSVVQV